LYHKLLVFDIILYTNIWIYAQNPSCIHDVCSHFVALFIGLLSVLGATAGAHRLWAHNTYTANTPLRVFLMICHTMLGQV